MNLAPETHCQISIGNWDNSNFAQDYPKILSISKGRTPNLWPFTST